MAILNSEMKQPDQPDNTRVRMIEATYRTHARAVFAALIRLLKDFDVAEEALQEAFKAAPEQWPKDGSGQSQSVAGVGRPV